MRFIMQSNASNGAPSAPCPSLPLLCTSRTLLCTLLSCALPFCTLLGCGGSDEENSSNEVEAAAINTKSIDPASLPIGNTLPPGVSERLRVSAPEDWFVPGRQSGYVAWFLRWESSKTPLIFLKEDVTTFEAGTITQDNVQAYAQTIADRLAKKEREPLEKILIVKLGDQYFVRYVIEGKAGGTFVERQILETQANGYTYLVELRVVPGKLVDYRDAGYAVAASLNFLSQDAADDGAADDGAPSESSPEDGNAEPSDG